MPDSQLPNNVDELANWFAEGIREEIKALEKNGGTHVYEVHSGEE